MKRKHQIIILFFLFLNIIYVSYSMILVIKYENEYNNIETSAIEFINEIDEKIKNSYEIKENCIDDSHCTTTISLNKFNEIKDIDIYYNEQLEDPFILIKNDIILLPENMSGSEYKVSYGKITDSGILLELDESIYELANDSLYNLIYESYGKYKIENHKKDTIEKIEHIRINLDWVFYGMYK